MMWEYFKNANDEDDEHYTVSENCLQNSCDGEKIIDGIVNHYKKYGKSENPIIISSRFLTFNWDEYMRFRRKANFYRNQGFDILEIP